MTTVKEWSTGYPASIDSTAQMPSLSNARDRARVSQWHAMRDAIIQLERLVGSDALEGGSLREREMFLEDGYYYLVHHMNAASIGIPRQNIPIAMNQGTSETVGQAIGNFSLDPGDYAVAGGSVTTEFRFIATAFITNTGFTGSVELHNLTDDSLAATLSFSDMSPTKLSSGVLSLPAGEKMYEVRILCVGSPPTGDMVVCRWTGFEITAVP